MSYSSSHSMSSPIPMLSKCLLNKTDRALVEVKNLEGTLNPSS